MAQDPANLVFVPFSYTVAAVLAANGSATVPLQLDPDADFELHYISGFSTLDAVADPRPNNFSVQLADRGNSRFWSNDKISQSVLTAPQAGGLKLLRPVVIAAKTNMSFNFTNLSANANTATIVLVGVKVLR